MSMPELPDNQRWYIKKNYIFRSLHLQEKRWWGWKSLDYMILLPGDALAEQASEILAGRGMEWMKQQDYIRRARRKTREAEQFPTGEVK